MEWEPPHWLAIPTKPECCSKEMKLTYRDSGKAIFGETVSKVGYTKKEPRLNHEQVKRVEKKLENLHNKLIKDGFKDGLSKHPH